MSRLRPGALCALVLLGSAFFLWGCLPAGRAPYEIKLYALDYRPLPLSGARLEQVIRIDRFSVAQVYNSSAMVYRPEAPRVAVYHYSMWRTNPSDMVADYLARDFRSSGLFRAVFSSHQEETTRFAVDGVVEELLESKETDGWKVIVDLDVTLLDLTKPDITSRVVFQRRYRAKEPIPDQSPDAFARGASEAMARLSAKIIDDVYRTIEATQ
ncbi:MAG: ABC-type transport auxiliary lipoprotein family protein [Syntrophorhabdales bacterium]|jgi:ABC-type uncharacterized transport system auxiliary subunit